MKTWKIIIISALALTAIAATTVGVFAYMGGPGYYTPNGTSITPSSPYGTYPGGMMGGAYPGYSSGYPYGTYDNYGPYSMNGPYGSSAGYGQFGNYYSSFAPWGDMGGMMGGFGMGMM